MGTAVGYWIIGLPLGGVLGCLWHWPTPLLGVWLGNVVALVIASSWVLIAVFCRINWLTVRRVDTRQQAPLLSNSQQRELATVASDGATEPTHDVHNESPHVICTMTAPAKSEG